MFSCVLQKYASKNCIYIYSYYCTILHLAILAVNYVQSLLLSTAVWQLINMWFQSLTSLTWINLNLTLNLETKGTLPSSMSTSSFAYNRNSSARVVNSAFFLISASTNTNVNHVTTKWTKFEKMNWSDSEKKGYKQIFIPVTMGLRKLFSDIQSPSFGSILGECRRLILSLSLFLSFKTLWCKATDLYTRQKAPCDLWQTAGFYFLLKFTVLWDEGHFPCTDRVLQYCFLYWNSTKNLSIKC